MVSQIENTPQGVLEICLYHHEKINGRDALVSGLKESDLADEKQETLAA